MRRRWLAVAAVTVVSSMLWPSAAGAQLFAFEGSVVTSQDVGGELTFFVRLFTGFKDDMSPPVRLTDEGDNLNPSYSADGRVLTFTSTRTGSAQIWGMGFNGSNQTQLFNQPGGAAEASPFPSAGGINRLAASFAVGSDTEICILDLATGATIQLTNNAVNDNSPAVSPDGQRILWRQARPGGSDIMVMGSDGSDQVQVTNLPGFESRPVWGASGNDFLFAHGDFPNGNIFSANADGSNPIQLTNGNTDSNPVPYPGGVAFVRILDSGPRLFGMGPAGQSPGPLNGQDIPVDPAGGFDLRPADPAEIRVPLGQAQLDESGLEVRVKATDPALLFVSSVLGVPAGVKPGEQRSLSSAATASRASKAKFKPATVQVEANVPTKVSLKPSKKAKKAIAKAADEGDKLKVTVTVTATNELGDVSEVTEKGKLKPK